MTRPEQAWLLAAGLNCSRKRWATLSLQKEQTSIGWKVPSVTSQVEKLDQLLQLDQLLPHSLYLGLIAP